jgi:tripartite ATP-independent transporter DctP family solute receptor
MAWRPAAPAESAEPVRYVIKLAYLVAETQSTHVGARDFFKPYVEEKSGGRIAVELYPNGILGGDRQVIEAVQLGTVQMTIPLAGVLSGFEPKFQLLDFPFLFKDKKSVYSALDGELGDKLNSLLIPLGLRNLAFAENGFRHFANNRGPINKPDDLKGLKVRTIESPIQVAAFRIFGASPTPMNFGELYTALQQKTVDAMENSTPIFYTSNFYEVQKYYSLANLYYAATVVLINEDYFQALPKDLQQVVQDGANLYRAEQRRISAEQEIEMLEALKARGLVVNEISQEDRELFQKAVLPLYDEFKGAVSGELLELAQKASR